MCTCGARRPGDEFELSVCGHQPEWHHGHDVIMIIRLSTPQVTKTRRFCNFLLRIGKMGRTRFGAGITFEHVRFCCRTFPEIPPVWCQNRTHSVFALRTTSHAWRTRGVQQLLFFAKPRGLENTHNTVMHVHKLVGSTPNKRAQPRETHFRSS